MKNLLWILLTTVGLAAGVVAALVLGEPIERVVGMVLVTPVLTLLVGAVLGAAQWLELRRLVEVRPLRWLIGTSVGMGAGLALGVVLVEQVGRVLTGDQIRLLTLGPAARALSFAVVGMVTGLLLGFGQSLALRDKLRRWPLACAAALGLGFPVSSLLVDGFLGGLGSPQGVVAFLVTAGVVLGTFTSTGLRRHT